MTKIKSKYYATALVEVLLQSKLNDSKIIKNFSELLVRQGAVHTIREIMLLAESLWYKKAGKKNIVLVSARNITTKNILKGFVKNGEEGNKAVTEHVKARVVELCKQFPIY